MGVLVWWLCRRQESRHLTTSSELERLQSWGKGAVLTWKEREMFDMGSGQVRMEFSPGMNPLSLSGATGWSSSS